MRAHALEAAEGLVLVEDFITRSEHDALLAWLDARGWRTEKMRGWRAAQSFGWVYEGTTREVTRNVLAPDLPRPLAALAERMTGPGAWFAQTPNQATAQAYRTVRQPALPLHTDHSGLGAKLATLSLAERWRMVMRHNRDATRRVNIVLPVRSLLLQRGSARYEWRHGITKIPRRPKGTARESRRRVSVTFRHIDREWLWV